MKTKPGFLTSEFWLHLLVVLAGSAGFWQVVQHYLSMGQSIAPGNGPIALALAIAVAFVGFFLTLAQLANTYLASRVQLKTQTPPAILPNAAPTKE